MAEQDRTRDIADNDLVLTSAEFAASIGWRLEPESPDGAVLSGGLGESPDDRDGDESDSFKAQHDAEVTPEIERLDRRSYGCGSSRTWSVVSGVHPRVIMQILRHADFKVTMEIYTEVVSAQTRDALKRLGDVLAEKVG